MKKLLLGLLALLVVAPAWGDNVKANAKAFSLAGVVIGLNNLTGNDEVSAVVAKLKENAVYQDAACGPAKTVKGSTRIYCAKNDSRLMAFLTENAPVTVRWDISCATAGGKCNAGCALMPCPSAVVCCNTTTHKPC